MHFILSSFRHISGSKMEGGILSCTVSIICIIYHILVGFTTFTQVWKNVDINYTKKSVNNFDYSHLDETGDKSNNIMWYNIIIMIFMILIIIIIVFLLLLSFLSILIHTIN